MMKNFAFRFLGVAMLVTACAFAFSGESSVGQQVDDSLAASIRGGGSCDNKFTWDNKNPVWCPGKDVGCVKQMPNTHSAGDGGTSGWQNEYCGSAAGCGYFTNAADCAKPQTAVATGMVME